MKRILLIGVALLLLQVAKAQEVIPDERLSARYSEQDLANMLEKSPGLIKLLNFQLDNGYEIVPMPYDKIAEFPELYYLDAENKRKGEMLDCLPALEQFNLFEFDFERLKSKRRYYRIADSNHVLIIYSNDELVKMYNSKEL